MISDIRLLTPGTRIRHPDGDRAEILRISEKFSTPACRTWEVRWTDSKGTTLEAFLYGHRYVLDMWAIEETVHPYRT